MSDWASESGHWYSKEGEPRYTTLSAKGEERPTTLRDARKHGWVPGATTIIGCAARFGLEKWKAEQLLLAGLTLPRADGEDEPTWIARVWADSKAQAEKAAARGTEIHAAVEAHFAGRRTYDKALAPWVDSISNLLAQQFGNQAWKAEKSFASSAGYGGKIDLHSDEVLVDLKGKQKPYEKWQVYDEHAMQVAAYAVGAKLVKIKEKYGWPKIEGWPTAAIVFFDRDEPYSEAHVIKPAELERGWQMFRSLLSYWQAANRYEP